LLSLKEGFACGGLKRGQKKMGTKRTTLLPSSKNAEEKRGESRRARRGQWEGLRGKRGKEKTFFIRGGMENQVIKLLMEGVLINCKRRREKKN